VGYHTVDETEVAGGMPELEERRDDDEAGYGATAGEPSAAAGNDRPERREPASDEEAEQDNYANTDEQEA
jgi:hypothetical protein